MYRFYVEPAMVKGQDIQLSGEDYNHIRNVLRMRPGEEITICDGACTDYHCVVDGFGSDFVKARILSSASSAAELPVKLVLFQGIPKKDKMEFIIQKAVELGASEIVPVMTARTIVKLEDAKKEQKKLERWQAIARAAAMQSMRGIIPKVQPVMGYGQALEYAAGLDMALIPYENAEGIGYTRQLLGQLREGNPSEIRSVGVLIGPEGGFCEEEVSQAEGLGIKPVTLGKRILRTETAGLVMLSLLMFELEKE